MYCIHQQWSPGFDKEPVRRGTLPCFFGLNHALQCCTCQPTGKSPVTFERGSGKIALKTGHASAWPLCGLMAIKRGHVHVWQYCHTDHSPKQAASVQPCVAIHLVLVQRWDYACSHRSTVRLVHCFGVAVPWFPCLPPHVCGPLSPCFVLCSSSGTRTLANRHKEEHTQHFCAQTSGILYTRRASVHLPSQVRLIRYSLSCGEGPISQHLLCCLASI